MDLPNLAPMIGVAIGLPIAFWITSRRNQKLAPRIEAALVGRDAVSLPELQSALDMKGFYARGKVVMALNELVQQGKVEEIPPPAGTPMLERVNHIKYRWKA